MKAIRRADVVDNDVIAYYFEDSIHVFERNLDFQDVSIPNVAIPFQQEFEILAPPVARPVFPYKRLGFALVGALFGIVISFAVSRPITHRLFGKFLRHTTF